MPRQRLLLGTLTEIPNLDHAIIAARGKLVIIGTEADGTTCFTVRLNRRQIVDLRRIVFERAGLVRRDEE